jgi:hypothetical protein
LRGFIKARKLMIGVNLKSLAYVSMVLAERIKNSAVVAVTKDGLADSAMSLKYLRNKWKE